MKRALHISAFALWAVCAGLVRAAPLDEQPLRSLVQTLRFAPPQVSLTAQGLSRVTLPDCESDRRTGLPVLPARGVSFDLPENAVVASVTVSPGGVRELVLDAPVEWGQPALQPDEQLAEEAPPDPAVYGSDEPYPDLEKPHWRSDATGGKRLLSVLVPPVCYAPGPSRLLAAETVTVTVTYRESLPAAIRSAGTPTPLTPTPHTYVVISTSNLVNNTPGPWNLQSLCDARARAGFTPAIVTTEWISQNYSGTNQAIRIRSFVQDAYQTWGLRYLLLAGTYDLLPVQRLYISFNDFLLERKTEIPADAIYYGCMDGTFDNNGNGRYGELTDGVNGGDVDLTAEVMVGRFPVSNAVELASMVRKTLRYEAATAEELQPHSFLAEKVNFGTLVYADGFMEELRYGAANNNLNSLGFKNSAYGSLLNADYTLYDSSNYLWTAADALTYLNSNLAMVNHIGHGATKQCLKIPLSLPSYQSAVAAFTNELPYFIYSQACSSGAFDTPDCFAEQIVTVSNAAFATVMNAREGWEYSDVVGGFSHRYHRAFCDAALRGTATRFGEINEQSRRMNLYLISSMSANYWRWVYFELNLFGDPATPFVPALNLVPPDISHTPLVNTYDTQSLHRVACTLEPVGIFDPDAVNLIWHTDRAPAPVQTQRMAQVTGNLFEAFIPPQPARTRVSYTISARNHAGCVTNCPASGDETFYVTDRLTLTIMGSPADYGSTDPAYGTYAFASGLVASASAPATVPLDDDTRLSNIGFFGTGSAPQSGTNQTVSFQMDTSSLLVWMWRRDNRLRVLSDIGAPADQSFWVPQGDSFPVPPAAEEVTLSNGTAYAFAEWLLDGVRSPAAPALSAPSYGSLAMDGPHTLTARYLPADADTDANGIADWWEYRYFGQAGQDPESDDDQDGFSLLDEYLDRSDPLSPGSFPAPPLITFSPLAETQAHPGPFTIRASITDTFRVSSACVYWHSWTNAWQCTPLTMTSNAVFEAQIGAGAVAGDDIEYQLVAADPSGHVSQTDVFYFFLCYPVADTTRFHDLSFVTLPTQSLAGAYMDLHNTGNADLVWTVQCARVEAITDPNLPCWDLLSIGQSWRISTNRFSSAPYALASKLQSSNTMSGPAVRATVTMAPLVVRPNAALSFRYWIHSEISTDPSRAFDGGIVEYSLDGGATFSQLKGPYTHTIYGWTYSPWTNGTPCLAGNGTEGWRTATFDFAKEYPEEHGFQGRTLVLRFHYGGDNNTDYEGWYIDDVSVRPIEWPRGFTSSIESTYPFTIPAGNSKRILWSNTPSLLEARDMHTTIFILSNDPAAPSFSFFWQMKIRDYPSVPELRAAQSTSGDGLVTLTAAVGDRDGEPVSLAVDWSGDKGKTWQPAALTHVSAAVGSAATNAPDGRLADLLTATNRVTFTNSLAAVWDSRAQIPAIDVNTQMLFRAAATNGFFGQTFTSPLFTVDNDPPRFAAGALSAEPLSEWGPYSLTTNLLALAWPPASDNPSATLTYRLVDTQPDLAPPVSVTNQTALLTEALSLAGTLNRQHRFDVVALDPAGNASAPLSLSLLVLEPSADYDGDGLCNADEETAGTLANDPGSRFIASLQTEGGSTGHLALSWNSATNRLYSVEVTPSLLPPDWQPLPGCTNLPGTGSPVTVELPESSASAFFRIRVYLHP